jgi:DNA invertase Pin-like site-specific DNA recombinase
MNCVVYARVSTDKQADLSIPAQLEAMRAYAHQKHWLVAEEFIEPGASAKTTERPALQRLLTRIRDSKRKTDVVLVHKIDRLARNVYDHATIKALLTQRHVQLASVVENVDDTVPGQLVENIMASIAQFYSANLSEEVKKGMRQKVLNGDWPHLPPRGYVSVKNADGHGAHIEVHPRLGPLVSRAFELYATGNYSLRSLAERLATDGLLARSGSPLPQSQIQRMFTNPFYAGRISWKGLDVPAKHRPLASPRIFERVQHVIKQRHRDVGVKGSVQGFPLRGIAICADCRGRMTAEQHERWGYYRCSRQSYKREKCTARFCNAHRAHADLQRVCQQIQIARNVAEAIRQRAEQLVSTRAARRDERMAALSAEQASLSGLEMQLTDEFTRGAMGPAVYRERSTYLRSRRLEIEEIVTRPPVQEEDLKARIKKTLDLATSIWDVYEALDDNRRNELLRAVFGTLVLAPDGIIGWSLKPPFDKLHGSDKSSAETTAAAMVDELDAA